MEEQTYFSFPDHDKCNRQSTEKPLMVNCAGCQYCRRKFDNNNKLGRKDYYLQYMIEGEITAVPDGTPEAFGSGSFVIWEADKPFHYRITDETSTANSEIKAVYLWIHFTGYHAGRIISELGLSMGRIYHTSSSEKSLGGILSMFTSLFDEFANRRPGTEEACAGILTSILVTLAREADKAAVGKMRRLVTVPYLHTHFREDTSVNELAAMEHLSVSRYREVFRRHTGLSPVDYRTALRLGNACRLLLQTDLTVAEIASDCGYSDVFFFIRIFKKKNGMTPGKYRACGGILQGKGTV